MSEAAVLLPVDEYDIPLEPRRRLRLHALPLRLKVGAAGVVLTVLAALLLPLWLGNSAYQMNPSAILSSPTWHDPFGTDSYGRSILARVALGMRISYEIGLLVSVATFIIGGGVGLVTGYVRSVDMITMRIIDAIMAIPAIMIALATATVFGGSVLNTVVVLSLFYAPRTVRIMRSAVLGVRESLYLEAARALGMGSGRIMLRHVLPNTLSPLVIQQTFILAYAILGEATFSFIGVGVPPPTPSLGNVLSEAQQVMDQAPWISIFPGGLIVVIVMSVNFLGDGIRDWLDVRMRDI